MTERTSQRPSSRPARRRPGEQPAFERVVADHGRTVFKVCRALLGRADADDAWSETFLSALKAYPSLPATANVEAWLVTIAHRKAIDITRRTSRAPTPVADAPAPAVDDKPRDLDLHDELSALPDKQRLTVVYHYLAGLPYDEVAAIVGGTTEAARRSAADGIARLRRERGVVPKTQHTPRSGK